MGLNGKGMELPISVMIVFFVAIAVALLVLSFAGQIISQGDAQLREFTLECTTEADFFVESYAVDTTTIVRLADVCYRNNLGSYRGDKICYILHGVNSVNAGEGEIISGFLALYTDSVPPPVVDLADAGKTVYIWFKQAEQNVEIRG